MRALAILCVKNEGAFLLEWLAHHRASGFTDVLVFSNDCSDGTDLMLDRLDLEVLRVLVDREQLNQLRQDLLHQLVPQDLWVRLGQELWKQDQLGR